MKFAVEFSVYEAGKKKPQYTVDSDHGGQLSLAELLEFLRANLIVIADTVLKEEQAKGFDKNPIVTVDGKAGKPVRQVSPFGQIEITARREMSEIMVETYRRILERSPVRTGRYKSSNYVVYNGQQVATTMEGLQSWLKTNPQFKPGDKIRFVNIQPYARKLERLGVRAGESGNIQKTRNVKSRRGGRERVRFFQPNGAYFLTSRSIISKYKRNASIRFMFITGAQMGLVGAGRVFKTGRKGSVGRTYLYPSILITVQEGGIL